ncbi:hypothetical protein [Methylobacterium sp. J-088]|uniref:hypothetical protein n=1 Tax=Methylobacterium sp. J-088 TaxID=2836664 RepID=UPI0028C3A152|nr:hypothetical protein [Methylobacterium sp. J-088]
MTDPADLEDRLAALEADNARLRRLLDVAGAPDGLRHGLRNTTAIMHRSAESAVDVEVDGLRFGLRLPLVPTVGRVIAGADAEASRKP